MHFDCLAWFTARFLAEKGNAVGQTGSQSDSLPAFPSFSLFSCPYRLPAPICLPVFKKSFFWAPSHFLKCCTNVERKVILPPLLLLHILLCSISIFLLLLFLFICLLLCKGNTNCSRCDVAFPCCNFATRAPRFFQVNTAQSLTVSLSLALPLCLFFMCRFLFEAMQNNVLYVAINVRCDAKRQRPLLRPLPLSAA